jgi:8-oxo-dGTP diphosphatase
MKIIQTITESDFGRTKNPNEWHSFSVRPGARAILLDNEFRIALMHVKNYGYYKLPGGGIDEGETIEDGLRRELFEEVGASSIEILAEIGQIDEYREEWKKKSEHYGFIAKLTGDLSEPERTDKEIEHGYVTVWAKDINEAITLVESGKPTEYGQDFERLRELTFLNYSKDSNLLING